MFLSSLSYSQHTQSGNDWHLNSFSLGKINLIVGKNSTGKSRTLNVLAALSNYLCDERKLAYSGQFDVDFLDNEKSVRYILNYSDQKVEKEFLDIDGTVVLDRRENGEGKILAEALENRPMIDFQVPESLLASVVRRDSIQHPYFDLLYNWGKSTRHYSFGSSLGKDRVAVFIENKRQDNLNVKETTNAVGFLKRGIKKNGDEFTKEIINEINQIGYDITELGVAPISNMIVEQTLPQQPEGIYIVEKGHSHIVEQQEISQGLFRAISLFIQLKYSEHFSEASLILIDDIGEGLDFDRSTKLIKSLIKMAEKSSIQLVMTTNDRFVMNNVPLQYWSVMQREGSRAHFLNYHNSKDIFEKFEITGLSNFDFFSSNFYNQ